MTIMVALNDLIGDRLSRMLQTQDLNITEFARLRSPRALKNDLPMTEKSNRTVVEGRVTIHLALQAVAEVVLVDR